MTDKRNGLKDQIYFGWDFEKVMEMRFAKLKISSQNEKIIRDFVKAMVFEGISPLRIQAHIYKLCAYANKLKKPFDEFTRKDVEDWALWLNKNYENKSTQGQWIATIHRLFRHMKDISADEDLPPEVKWLKIKGQKKRLRNEDLITQEEYNKIFARIPNLRDRAIVAVLWESGMRIGEVLNLRVGDIHFEGRLAHVNCDGKTGERSVLIRNSVAPVMVWLGTHPHKDDPTAPLWVAFEPFGTRDALSVITFGQQLNYYVKVAGVKKRIHPHLFRHTRATILHETMPLQAQKTYMGWHQDSNMIGTYAHLSTASVDLAVLKAMGEDIAEVKKEDTTILRCVNCNSINPAGAKVCVVCKQPTTDKLLVQQLELNERVNNFLNWLENDTDNELQELIRKKYSKAKIEK